jgi:prolyl oligopeptidase
LQASQAGDKPVLIRVETTSGHGASNLTKSLEEIRDIYAFILANTGGSVPKKF